MKLSNIVVLILILFLSFSCSKAERGSSGYLENEDSNNEFPVLGKNEPESTSDDGKPGDIQGDPLIVFASEYGGEWFDDANLLLVRRNSKNMFIDLGSDQIERIHALELSGEIHILPDLGKLYNLKFLASVETELDDIESIRGALIDTIILSNTKVQNISALQDCLELRLVYLDGTLIERLPDFSKLSKLDELVLSRLQKVSLENIEKIPNAFDLNIMQCSEVSGLDFLVDSKVANLYIDEVLYERNKKWFEDNMEGILKKNPDFKVLFEVESGL